MNNLFKIIFIIICFSLNSCSKEKKINILKDENLELQMVDAYKVALKALNEQDVIFAAKKFNEAEILYPQSIWAPKAALMAAYAYYTQDYFGDAIFELKRFIKTYPNNPKIDYAHFLLAMCYYESIIDEKKDLRPLLQAQEKFKFVIKEYPTTDFALDSQFKLDLIFDMLASKEIYLGKYYIKKEKWVAAINRFKKVVEEYGTTIYVEEALHRLVEIYYKIGLVEESKKYAALLGYNYLSSDWYKQSYRVFNKDYSSSTSKIKKKGNFITRKFKTLFD
jgi:outer membrane protein assembly factor BamD